MQLPQHIPNFACSELILIRHHLVQLYYVFRFLVWYHSALHKLPVLKLKCLIIHLWLLNSFAIFPKKKTKNKNKQTLTVYKKMTCFRFRNNKHERLFGWLFGIHLLLRLTSQFTKGNLRVALHLIKSIWIQNMYRRQIHEYPPPQKKNHKNSRMFCYFLTKLATVV